MKIARNDWETRQDFIASGGGRVQPVIL